MDSRRELSVPPLTGHWRPGHRQIYRDPGHRRRKSTIAPIR